jgi:hypothetical protein
VTDFQTNKKTPMVLVDKPAEKDDNVRGGRKRLGEEEVKSTVERWRLQLALPRLMGKSENCCTARYVS